MVLLKQLSCRRAAPLLARWSEDPVRLSPAERSRVDRHLVRCAACREQVDTMRRMADLLRRERPHAARPAPDLWSSLEARIAEEPQDAPPLLPRFPVAPEPAPAGGWRRVLARTIPIGVAATMGLFVLTFRADFSLFGGASAGAPQVDGAAVAVTAPLLLPPGGVVKGVDATAPPATVRPAGAPAAAPVRRRSAAGSPSRPAAVALSDAREQARLAAEALRREGGVRSTDPGVGRANPFEPLRRPESAPVLTSAVAVAGTAKTGPSAAAPAPLRGRPSGLLPVATAASAPSAPRPAAPSAGAASLDPPAARPPQLVAMAADAGSSRAPARGPEGGAAVSPLGAPEWASAPGEGGGDDRDGARSPGQGRRGAVTEVALAPSSSFAIGISGGRADGEGTPSAVEAVSAQRRQRSLFHYGGASERQR